MDVYNTQWHKNDSPKWWGRSPKEKKKKCEGNFTLINSPGKGGKSPQKSYKLPSQRQKTKIVSLCPGEQIERQVFLILNWAQYLT